MMKDILVTGATGNIGAEVVRLLVASGHTVRAGLRNPTTEKTIEGATPVHLDLSDATTFPKAIAGCGALFLLRPPPISDMEPTLNALIRQSRLARIDHIVFASVMGADKKSWVPHAKVEKCLLESNDWTILRPGFFAQNLGDAYLQDILTDNRIYVPAAQGRVSFIDARDIAAAAVAVLQSPTQHRTQAYTLTGPEALTFNEVTATLSDALGRVIRYEPASIPGYMWHLRVRRKLPLMQVLIQTILHTGLRSGEAAAVNDTLTTLIQRPPRTLKTYIQDNLTRWRQP